MFSYRTVILYNFSFTNVRSLNVITAVSTYDVKKSVTKPLCYSNSKGYDFGLYNRYYQTKYLQNKLGFNTFEKSLIQCVISIFM